MKYQVDQQVAARQTFFQRMFYDRRLPEELVQRLWIAPDSIMDKGQELKLSGRTTVARVSLPDISATVADGLVCSPDTGVLKRFNPRGIVHSARHLFMTTRADRVWTYGRMLVKAGVITPCPLAMLENRWGPCRLGSYILTEYLEGTPLRVFLNQLPLSASTLEHISLQIAELWWRLDELRITHGDLKSLNLIVTPDKRIGVIDLDGVRHHRFDSTYLRHRRRDWRRLFLDWRHRPEVEEALRSAIVNHARTTVIGARLNKDPAFYAQNRAA